MEQIHSLVDLFALRCFALKWIAFILFEINDGHNKTQYMQYILVILVGDFALLIPLTMSTCPGGNGNLSGAYPALLILLVIWKVLMLIAGVYLAIKCRVINEEKFQERTQVGYAI